MPAGPEPHRIDVIQLALEDTILQAVSPVAHRPKYLAAPLRIADVVDDKIDLAHGRLVGAGKATGGRVPPHGRTA